MPSDNLRRYKKHLSRAAFTLVEVVLVLVILGIISGLATVSLSGHIRRAKIVQTAIALEQADQFARTMARRDQGMLEIRFLKKTGKIEVGPIQAPANAKTTRRWALPNGVQIGEFRRAGGIERTELHRVLVAADGMTATYALTLRMGNRLGPSLITLGFSGQQVQVEDQADVATYFPR